MRRRSFLRSALGLIAAACAAPAAAPSRAATASTSLAPRASPTSTPTPTPAPSPTAQVPVGTIDTHAHLASAAQLTQAVIDAAVQGALDTMPKNGLQLSLLIPQPNRVPQYDYEVFAPIVQKYPDRFAFGGGGGKLNPLIQQAVAAGTVSADLQRQFEATAREIVAAGAAGFGEFAALHLSFASWHPYEAAPADHPLFLLLADIAADANMPIDLHMEAVAQSVPLSATPFGRQPHPTQNNPATIPATMPGFERLLEHNRKARIVWAHAGWDNTGERSVGAMRTLLQKHPNLYMQLKIDPTAPPPNRPIEPPISPVKAEWSDLLRELPDRFLIGSDVFYAPPNDARFGGDNYLLQMRLVPAFLRGLPADLRRKVGYDNVLAIYRLR